MKAGEQQGEDGSDEGHCVGNYTDSLALTSDKDIKGRSLLPHRVVGDKEVESNDKEQSKVDDSGGVIIISKDFHHVPVLSTENLHIVFYHHHVLDKDDTLGRILDGISASFFRCVCGSRELGLMEKESKDGVFEAEDYDEEAGSGERIVDHDGRKETELNSGEIGEVNSLGLDL